MPFTSLSVRWAVVLQRNSPTLSSDFSKSTAHPTRKILKVPSATKFYYPLMELKREIRRFHLEKHLRSAIWRESWLMMVGSKYFPECIMVLLIVLDWAEASRKQTKWGVFFYDLPTQMHLILTSISSVFLASFSVNTLSSSIQRGSIKKTPTTSCVPTIAATWLPVLLLPTEQRVESHKDDSTARNEGWLWCRQCLLCINIRYCIWTPALIPHYWAVPVRSEFNGIKRCLVHWPRWPKPL